MFVVQLLKLLTYLQFLFVFDYLFSLCLILGKIKSLFFKFCQSFQKCYSIQNGYFFNLKNKQLRIGDGTGDWGGAVGGKHAQIPGVRMADLEHWTSRELFVLLLARCVWAV